jgi:hypothetical protein
MGRTVDGFLDDVVDLLLQASEGGVGEFHHLPACSQGGLREWNEGCIDEREHQVHYFGRWLDLENVCEVWLGFSLLLGDIHCPA